MATSSARAQPADDATAQAGIAFKEGERAFAAHDYEAALERFKRAFSLSPHDAVRFNLAVCYERLAQFRAAIAEYDAAATSKELDQAAIRRARDGAARIEPLLATLIVRGQSGTRVLVEGAERCVVPCRVTIDPRPQAVTLRAPSTEKTVRIEPARGADVSLTADFAGVSGAPAASLPHLGPEPTPRADTAPKRRFPGWLTWTGAGVAVIGGVGITTFGLRANALHDTYVAAPTIDTRDEGVRMRTLTNVSIAVVGLGAALVLADLIFTP